MNRWAAPLLALGFALGISARADGQCEGLKGSDFTNCKNKQGQAEIGGWKKPSSAPSPAGARSAAEEEERRRAVIAEAESRDRARADSVAQQRRADSLVRLSRRNDELREGASGRLQDRRRDAADLLDRAVYTGDPRGVPEFTPATRLKEYEEDAPYIDFTESWRRMEYARFGAAAGLAYWDYSEFQSTLGGGEFYREWAIGTLRRCYIETGSTDCQRVLARIIQWRRDVLPHVAFNRDYIYLDLDPVAWLGTFQPNHVVDRCTACPTSDYRTLDWYKLGDLRSHWDSVRAKGAVALAPERAARAAAARAAAERAAAESAAGARAAAERAVVERATAERAAAERAAAVAQRGIPSLNALVDSIRFFEVDRATPDLADRLYTTLFDSASIRYIYVELSLSHPPPSQRREILVTCTYQSLGDAFSLFPGRKDTLSWNLVVEATWASVTAAAGRGSATPGAVFPVGAYAVDCSAEGHVIAQGTFAVVRRRVALPSLNARFVGARLYERGSEDGPDYQRVYTTEFDAATTRYIGIRLDFEFPPPGSRITVPFSCRYLGPNGTLLGSIQFALTPDPSWAWEGTSGWWGWAAPGGWTPGRYHVECSGDGGTFAKIGFNVK